MITNIPAEELYFEWLCSLVEDSRNEDIRPYNYSKLLRKLFETKFYWLIDKDSNRAGDGIYMRYRFECRTGNNREEVNKALGDDCFVLEMLIALAKRLEDDMLYDMRYGDRIGKWFWMMIGNLGLIECDDENFFESEVEEILERFMSRNYFSDGEEGALFHSYSRKINLRTADIWEQANLWIVENMRANW